MDKARVEQVYAIFGASSEAPFVDTAPYLSYLDELSYEALDAPLFRHLFPTLLLSWSHALVGGPTAAIGLYRVFRNQEVLNRLTDAQTDQVLVWIADVYADFVDEWGPEVNPSTPHLNAPIAHFHALGQSLPVTHLLLERLQDVRTLGRAYWWLLMATGVIWERDMCPYTSSWAQCVDVLTSVVRVPYLPVNLTALETVLTSEVMTPCLVAADAHLFCTPDAAWHDAALEELLRNPDRTNRELARLRITLATAWQTR